MAKTKIVRRSCNNEAKMEIGYPSIGKIRDKATTDRLIKVEVETKEGQLNQQQR